METITFLCNNCNSKSDFNYEVKEAGLHVKCLKCHTSFMIKNEYPIDIFEKTIKDEFKIFSSDSIKLITSHFYPFLNPNCSHMETDDYEYFLEFIGVKETITEDMAKRYVLYHNKYGVYQNYSGSIDDMYDCDTAIKSLMSAIPEKHKYICIFRYVQKD